MFSLRDKSSVIILSSSGIYSGEILLIESSLSLSSVRASPKSTKSAESPSTLHIFVSIFTEIPVLPLSSSAR